jgi:hypothetical protein
MAETVVNPFELLVYSKNYAFLCWIGSPEKLSVVLRHNDVSTASVTVSIAHPEMENLDADGARMVIKYRDEDILHGIVEMVGASGPTVEGTVTFTVTDHFRLFNRVLGFPNPTELTVAGTLPSQGEDTAYYTMTGNAETIVKDFVTKNAITRLADDVTVAPDLGRGAVIAGGVSIRMHKLYDRLFPAVDQAGIGVTVRQVEDVGLVVDCYTPTQYPLELSEDGGTISMYSWTKSNPTKTRVVAGGQGEGTARQWVYVTDTPLESQYNDIIEEFRDARDAADTTILTDRANESLTAGKPLAGLSLTLSESETFQYGGEDGVHVGDLVSIDLGNFTITDVLREARFNWDFESGLTVTPSVGEKVQSPEDQVASAVRQLARGYRELKARK